METWITFTLTAWFLIIPVGQWHTVVLRASAAVGNASSRNLVWLPWLSMPCLIYRLVVACVRVFLIEPKWGSSFMPVAAAALSAYGLAVFFSMVDVPGFVEFRSVVFKCVWMGFQGFFAKILSFSSLPYYRAPSSNKNNLAAAPGFTSLVQGKIQTLEDKELWHSGHRFKADVMNYVILFALSPPTLFVPGSLTLVAVHISAHLLVAATAGMMIVGFPDHTSCFATISPSSPGFGLLIDRVDLRSALQAVLLAGNKRYTGPFRTYKASISRMEETLAVSYRRQQHSVPIGPDGRHSLNMTRWQMATLSDAIKISSCKYVWIDVVSVPQKSHRRLQKALLSRMLTVYAAAAETVALRSAEYDGDRYHQRGWTLQVRTLLFVPDFSTLSTLTNLITSSSITIYPSQPLNPKPSLKVINSLGRAETFCLLSSPLLLLPQHRGA
jgi:hypothetical protein